MSVPKDMNFGHLTATIAAITNVETAAITSKAVIMPYSTAHILIFGSWTVQAGAAAVNVTPKLYRGVDLTGVLVATLPANFLTAAQADTFAFNFQEDLAAAASLQYTLSLTCSVNQAGNSITSADIIVTVL